MLSLFAVTGCGSNSPHTPESCPTVYEEGKKEAISTIKREAQNDTRTYVDAQVLEEIILNNYGEDTRDAILFDPDVEFYTAGEMIDGFIEDSGVTEPSYDTYSYPDNLEPN